MAKEWCGGEDSIFGGGSGGDREGPAGAMAPPNVIKRKIGLVLLVYLIYPRSN
jgi:hypothetical protein